MIIDKIIQGYGIAIIFQIVADGDKFLGGFYIFQDFDHDLVFGKCRRQVSLEQVLGEIDETGTHAGDLLDSPGQKS